MQLVYGRDAILPTKFEANWKYIKERKQLLIKKNNERENSKRIAHEYKTGDKVLYTTRNSAKYGQARYKGPYEITQVHDNGTVQVKKGAVTETINIRLLTPYYE